MSRDKVRYFLLVFDHEAGLLRAVTDFGTDSDRALAAYSAKERECDSESGTAARRIEVVLIGSDSLETVRRTHGNYFPESEASSRYFDLVDSK